MTESTPQSHGRHLPTFTTAIRGRRKDFMRPYLAVLCFSALCSPLEHLNAEDEEIFGWQHLNDLRVGYSTMPLKASIETKANNVQGYEKDGQLQSGARFSLMWVLPLSELSDEGGGLLALEASSTTYHQDQTLNDPEITLKAYALTIHPDLAWALTSQLHLVLGPFAGIGLSSITEGSGQGTYFEYGGRIALYWTIRRHFQIGLDGRYQGTYARQNFTYGASSEDVEIRTSGASGGAQLGYRF